MSIYKNIINTTKNGSTFKIDLVKKNLWINKKQMIKEGVVVYENWLNEKWIEPNDLDGLFEYDPVLNEACWNVAEMLYEKYKYSSPRENKLSNKSYFKAKNADELLDRHIAYGLDRNYAQALVEGYILCASLSGWLIMNDDHWFYQGCDREFVVLKEWI